MNPMQTTTVVITEGLVTVPLHAVVEALLAALGVTPGAGDAVLSADITEDVFGSGIYGTTRTTETRILTGVPEVVLQMTWSTTQLQGPVDPDETLTATVGATDPERLTAAVAVLEALGRQSP